MPMKWVEPEIFGTFHDAEGVPITIYHAYKNDDWDSRLTFHYEVQNEFGEGEMFDVRELPLFDEIRHLNADNPEHHLAIIMTNVRRGVIASLIPTT